MLLSAPQFTAERPNNAMGHLRIHAAHKFCITRSLRLCERATSTELNGFQVEAQDYLVAACTERLAGFSPFAYALSPFIQVICRGLRLLPADANPVHDSTSWRDDGTTGDYRSVGPCAPGTVDTARANDRVCFAYDAECRQDGQKCSGNFDHCQLLFPQKNA
jgi:hypothetical protein